jgi:hypothetical protein
MFGKSSLKKIIAMLNDLTDEELDELIAVAEDAKDGDGEEEEIKEDKVETKTETEVEEPDGEEEKVEEKTEVEEETKTEEDLTEAEEIPEEETEEEEEHKEVDGEILTSIKAIKETIEALAARMDALEAEKTEERNDFEFGLEGKDGVSEEKKDSLSEIKKKYWNI